LVRVLIIGYGNPLRGDDGFGFRAAQRLRSEIDDPQVEIVAMHQLTPELMEPLSRTDRAIFIDAEWPAPTACRTGSAFTHHLTPAALIAGAQALYGRAAEATLLTTPGHDFDFGESLSPAVENALEETVERVRAILRRPSTS
jgi:hydrogenase maturation protease